MPKFKLQEGRTLVGDIFYCMAGINSDKLSNAAHCAKPARPCLT